MSMVSATLVPQFWRRSPEVLPKPSDTAGNSGTVAAFDAIDAFLDLSGPGPAKLQKLHALNPAEQSLFMRHLSELIRFGVVGTETLEVDGQTRHTFAETRYADPTLHGARRQRLRTPLDLRG